MSTTESSEAYALSAEQRLNTDYGQGTPVRATVRVEGPLDLERLRQAVGAVVARHEALRTSLWRPRGLTRPLQLVDEPEPVVLLGTDDAAHDHHPPGGTLSVAVGRRSDHHLLRLTLAAHAGDVTSCAVIVADLARAYSTPDSFGAEPSPVQYADYASWQAEVDTGAASPATTWPRVDALGEPPGGQSSGTRLTRHVDASSGALSSAVAAASDHWGVGVPSWWAAAWAVLHWRRHGGDGVTFAELIDGRQRDRALADAVGPYMHPVPVHVELDEDDSFEAVVRRVDASRRRAVEAPTVAWPDARELRRSLVFSASPAPGPVATAQGVTFTILGAPSGALAGTLDLHLHGDRPPSATLEAVADLLGVDELDAISSQLTTLVEAATHRSDEAVGRLRLTSDAERPRLVSINDRRGGATRVHATIHALFAEQARRTPDRPAVVSGEDQLTFAELDSQANGLAHRLQALRAGSGDLVGICVDRSLDMVVAVLGTLKAGSAYLPLDPGTLNPGRSGYPAERLAFMLKDSAVSVLVTQADLAPDLPPGAGTTICIDEPDAVQQTSAPPPDGTEPHDLAYAIYTSGSTGRPKAALVEHRSVINLWRALNEVAVDEPPGREWRVSLNAPLGFDPSVQQLVQLLGGATLVVVPEDIRADGSGLLSLIDERAIDVWDCTPHQLRLLVKAGLTLPGRAHPSVVLCGGEAMDDELWQEVQKPSELRVYNVYGPTECTVDSTIAPVDGAHVTIGRPLSGVHVLVLDDDMQPVPPGALGEIWIGGMGLARGYLNRPELTAERFRQAPFDDERLYRTGDLARLLPDGSIAYVGRSDGQVKVRSHRIETGEIESVLRQLPGIEDVAVVARGDDPTERRLFAYLVHSSGALPSTTELRSYLKAWVPEYMIPAAFVPIAEMPLTGNGKVDRAALPEPSSVRPVLDVAYVGPRDDLERRIVAAWAYVFDIDDGEVGVDDDFFDFGGDSLLAANLATELEDVLGVEIPVERLATDVTTVALIADAVRDPIASQERSSQP